MVSLSLDEEMVFSRSSLDTIEMILVSWKIVPVKSFHEINFMYNVLEGLNIRAAL